MYRIDTSGNNALKDFVMTHFFEELVGRSLDRGEIVEIVVQEACSEDE
jgi:hypothetical protein